MASATLFASNEFGFAPLDLGNSGSNSGSQAPTSLGAVEKTVIGAWYQHPGVAIFTVVAATAYLVGSTVKTVSGGVRAKVGPAEGSAEGSI